MTRALVLCAGKGTRLGPLGEACPKPLLDVGGRPLLAHLLTNLARSGVREAVVNTHHLPHQFDAFARDWNHAELQIRIHPEAALRGSAGTLRCLRPMLEGQASPFLVHYGDILTDEDFSALQRAAHHSNRVGAILVHERQRPQSVATLEDGRVTSFEERPVWVNAVSETFWTFSGVAAFNDRIFSCLDSGAGTDLPRDFFPILAREGLLNAVPCEGRRVAVDTMARLVQARSLWPSNSPQKSSP